MARTDDPAISDDDNLWHRILVLWIVPDGSGGWRPSSAAFLDDRSGEVSVHVARITTQECVLASYPEQSLAEIAARIPRSLGHIVAFDEKPDDPSHAVICPPPDIPNKRRKSAAREMAKRAHWVVLKLPS